MSQSAARGRTAVAPVPQSNPVTAILVLGMHRSGTSALTRALNLWGVDLSSNVIAPRNDNPTGFWEAEGLWQVNDHALAALDSAWDDFSPLTLDALSEDVVATFKSGFMQVLYRDFARSSLFVLKDPRLCRLVPLALDALRDYGASPVAVIPVRNPLEVAHSLRRRDGMTLQQGQLLWLRYVLDAEFYTRAIPRVFVTYDALLADWRSTRQAIGSTLSILWPQSEDAAAAAIGQFLSADHRHHAVDGGQDPDAGESIPWVAQAFAALTDASGSPGDLSLQATFDRLREEFDRIHEGYRSLITHWHARLRELTASRESWDRERQVLQTTVESQQRTIDSQHRTIDALEGNLSETRATASDVQQQLLKTREKLHALKRSPLWRFTKPVRGVGTCVRRLIR